MMKTLFAFVLIVASIDLAVAQGAAGTKRPEYATAAQALQGLRAKPGVKISVQSGWTVIEDRSTLSIWSFPPAGHRAYPTAIQRKVVQEGSNVFVKMNVLCEAPKPDCDAVVAEFGKLNGRVRDDLNSKTR
ncbi:hypothetical protein [Bradyrhizobium sp.]|jgi:hypothetical protein|uniref:hypothetical protein n=1 Tax=Bradyrhizobium sp. TaxID=376 RepID=UPI003BB21785